MKDYIKEFMFISVGKAGLNIRLSKFGTTVIAILIIIVLSFISNLIIKEISQRNIEIERHRQIIQNLKKEVNKKEVELKELKEFRDLMDAIKNLSELKDKERKDLAMVIYKESKKYKYDWKMILALVMTESDIQPKLTGAGKACGLMQIKYNTARSAGEKIGLEIEKIKELYDIETNISIGSYYLFEQILQFRDIKKAMIAYNMGPAKAEKKFSSGKNRGKEPGYVKKVLNNYNYLKENFQNING